MRSLVVDIETLPIVDAAEYLEPLEPPANYVNQDAIERWMMKARIAQLQRCSLDPDLCRICALGVKTEELCNSVIAPNEEEEAIVLNAFWDLFYEDDPILPRLITFNGHLFDLVVIMRRSLYLGVSHETINLDRYKTPHLDLWAVLSQHGRLPTHSLHFYAKRFGIPIERGDLSGEQVARLALEDKWEEIAAHNRSDLEIEAALAARLGFLMWPQYAAQAS